MTEPSTPKINKWPFVLGDLLLLGFAGVVLWQGSGPMTATEMALCAGVVALGAILAVTPFVLEYRGLVQLTEADVLAEAVKRLQNLEAIANHVTAATAQWHGVQDQAAQTLRASKEVADRMAAEAAEFREFLKKANDAEKATLRLEVEKLRRVEGDWLQVVVRILDHIFALHNAALHASKTELTKDELLGQLAAFQHACRDIARRVGLVPFEAQPGEPFNDERHKSVDEKNPVPDDAQVKETLGPGIAFQGKLVRPALVLVETVAVVVPESDARVPEQLPAAIDQPGAEVRTESGSEPSPASAASEPEPSVASAPGDAGQASLL